jgi:hypothetical protein
VPESSVVVLVADGLRPDVFDAAIRAGEVPELAALRDVSGPNVVTTVFPSVTGVAYVPFLTGMHPAEAGVPGLRWYDRSRALPALIGHARSYVGTQIQSINADLSPAATTLYERVGGNALGVESVVTRGLPAGNQLDHGWRYAARVIHAHVTGDVARWSRLEEELAGMLVARVRRERPRFVFAAFTSGDKATHAGGDQAPGVRRSLRLIDHVAASIRRDAEADGRWSAMHLWMVSDHGHSAVANHFDLTQELRKLGVKVRAHPWTIPDRSEAAVMVSGNSMAHVYLGLEAGARRPWPALGAKWTRRIEPLWMHPAIDLVAMKRSATDVEVRRGSELAEVSFGPGGISYRTIDGNPLGVDPFDNLCEDGVHERTLESAYPDSVAQLARLVLAERSGDLVVSASHGWDLRSRYEPIDHVSSHGALHAAHMLVPLVGNRRINERPRRTVDLHRILERELGLEKRRGSA